MGANLPAPAIPAGVGEARPSRRQVPLAHLRRRQRGDLAADRGRQDQAPTDLQPGARARVFMALIHRARPAGMGNLPIPGWLAGPYPASLYLAGQPIPR